MKYKIKTIGKVSPESITSYVHTGNYENYSKEVFDDIEKAVKEGRWIVDNILGKTGVVQVWTTEGILVREDWRSIHSNNKWMVRVIQSWMVSKPETAEPEQMRII